MRSPTKNFELFSQITAVAIIVIITIDSQGKLNEEVLAGLKESDK